MLSQTQKTTKETASLPKGHGGAFAVGVLLFALALAFAYSFALDRLNKKAELAESNFQANLLRLGEFLHGKSASNAVLVGSSMGARLLPSFFPTLHPANISLDGSSGRTGLRFLLDANRPIRLLLIEENTLTRPADNNDALLFEAVREPQMRIAGWLPFLRASYRPSSVVYSILKKRIDSSRGTPAAPLDPKAAPSIPPSAEGGKESIDPNLQEAAQMIHAIQAKGTRVLLYRLPAGQRSRFGPSLLQQAFPEMPFVDLSAELAAMGHVPRYSDGLHLVGPSAKAAAQALENAVAKYGLAAGNTRK